MTSNILHLMMPSQLSKTPSFGVSCCSSRSRSHQVSYFINIVIRAFFVRKCILQLFSNYSLALKKFGKRILMQKLLINVDEFDYRCHISSTFHQQLFASVMHLCHLFHKECHSKITVLRWMTKKIKFLVKYEATLKNLMLFLHGIWFFNI